VVALVDHASRRTVGLAIGRSESAGVTEAAIVPLGPARPVTFTFDNGSAVNSKRIAGTDTRPTGSPRP